ncbi:MAG: glycine betaine ABC transporter substrate-binding protein [Pseudomonadota bacterium]
MNSRSALWAALCALVAIGSPASAETIRIASKNFTESYILAETAAQLLEARGFDVERRLGLGGTKICFDALIRTEIDLYPEYSGTIRSAILDSDSSGPLDRELRSLGLRTYAPPGFNNTYVLAIRRSVAESRGITKISDLVDADDLDIAVSHEFRARNDGWEALSQHYGLSLPVRSIEHALAYQALTDGSIDITDAYSTDGELARAGVTLLRDDLDFFPRYDALWLARTDLPTDVIDVLGELESRIDDALMQSLNARAVIDSVPITTIAADFLREQSLVSEPASDNAILRELLRNTLTHIQLTMTALVAAAALGVTLAMVVQPFPRLASALLYVCGLIQTIPSIALLALMIPLFGIGWLPAVIALFLYALLPVVRATLTAFSAIEADHLTVAAALGMNDKETRRYVLLPLAMPHIIAGLRVAAVISIGTATLAAFIGAGGLGQPIVTGLALNDSNLILQGAIPAALLAIVTDLVFDIAERRLVPAHLRRSKSAG